MYKSYSFNTVTVQNGREENREPVANNAPLPNGLSSNPQVVTLGADAVHTNVPDSGTTGSTTPEDKPKMPTWVWYIAAAAILFVLLKK
jgi:hypothetical protein